MKLQLRSVFLLILYQQFAEANVLTLAKSTKNVQSSCGATILSKAYREIGVELEYIHLPARRALSEAEQGNVDGLINRIEGLEVDYSHLVRILTPICENTYSLYVLNNNNSAPLKRIKELSIGVKRGNLPLERALSNYNVYPTTSYLQLIKMLITKRVDAIAVNDVAFVDTINKNEFRVFIKDFKKIAFPFPKIQGFHYLNKDQKKLIPLISKQLEVMEKTGELQKLRKLHLDYLESIR